MEKRTLLAVVLSLGILLGWSYFFQKPVPQKPAPPGQARSAKDQAVKPETVQPAGRFLQKFPGNTSIRSK